VRPGRRAAGARCGRGVVQNSTDRTCAAADPAPRAPPGEESVEFCPLPCVGSARPAPARRVHAAADRLRAAPRPRRAARPARLL